MLLDLKWLNINIWWKNIIKNVNFTLEKWNILSIFWYNGSWKTTLLKSIIWLVESTWDIFFNWKNINKIEIYERSNIWIAYIMQEIPEYVWITIYNYLKNILKDKFNEKKISELFNLFWLDYKVYNKRNFDQHLSWWEKKKIEIITNFMMDKNLYLLDEVETSLDASSKAILIDLILEKTKTWTSFIIVSHNQDLIQIASKWLLVCNWKIQEKWDIKNIYKKYIWECVSCCEKNNCIHKI